MKMDQIAQSLSPLLDAAGIAFTAKDGKLHIPLPNGFGELQVGDLEANDTIIGLVGSDWHTHADQLLDYRGSSDAENILRLLKGMFAGDLLLIEEQELGKSARRTIEDDLESYVKYLPAGVEYRIYNRK